MIIYKITNNINNKIYVGKTEKTLEERWKKHLFCVNHHINRYLYDAINCYGINNFSIEKIDETEDNEELNEKEKYWIKKYNSTKKENGYNMQDGGIGGKQPEEIIKKIADKKRGVSWGHHSDIAKKNIGLAHIGGNNSSKRPEVREKIRNTLLKKHLLGELKINIPNLKGENHPMFGKHHTKEARIKISKAREGKTYEELFGLEKANSMKQERRDRMLGINNINYRSGKYVIKI
jgi:group I intron endonuclease